MSRAIAGTPGRRHRRMRSSLALGVGAVGDRPPRARRAAASAPSRRVRGRPPLIRLVGRRWAAVLACGDGAVVSHASAADAWDIRARRSAIDRRDRRAAAAARDGAASGRTARSMLRRRRDHRAATGLPITTPARTLLDLAASGVRGRRARGRRSTAPSSCGSSTSPSCESSSRATRGRPGTASLRAQLARYRGPVDTRSELERSGDRALRRPRSSAAVGQLRH